MKKNDIPYELIAQCFAGECSTQEKQELQAWVDADPSRNQIVETLHKLWIESGMHKDQFDTDALWESIDARTTEFQTTKTAVRGGTSSFRWVSRIAAVILLLISATFAVYKLVHMGTTKSPELETRVFSTERKERVQFRLGDGSMMWLNAASTVRIPTKFGIAKRELFLEGEAYFEVTRNERLPFIVHTKNADVRVLGTQFNVRARNEEQKVDVVVAGGTVLVRTAAPSATDSVVLTMGLQSTLKHDGSLSAPRKVNVEKYTAWVKGKLVFDQTPITQALKELERWFGIQCSLTLKDRSAQSLRITASFNNETLDEVLHIISRTTELQFKKNGNTVVFSEWRRK